MPRLLRSGDADDSSLQVCVLGGTGFIGKELVARLAAAGHGVRVLTRSYAQHNDLSVLPTVRFTQVDVHDEVDARRV